MIGGMTFRQAIDLNKKAVLEYLSSVESAHTRTIWASYKGEKDIAAVRKALNELRKEDKITTDDHVHMWQGKLWKIKKEDNQ